MRAFARAAGFVVAVALGGCAEGIGLPDMPMLSGASGNAGGTVYAAAQGPAVVAALGDLPPLPERNPVKRRVATSQGGRAANKAESSSFSLSSLAKMNILAAGAPVTPDTVHSESSPVAAYTLIAQQIHACWLTPGASKLPNHGFHASVSPKDGSTAKIVLYKKGPDKRRGVLVFRIAIGESGGGSVITSHNRRLDAKLADAFKADLARWAKGDDRCKG